MKSAFHPVWSASGTEGTFGEKYWYHWLTKLVGCFFPATTFVAKTVTAYYNKGNTPVKEDGFTPREFFPRSVYITFRLWLLGVVLNCYGLSQGGIVPALGKGKWQKRRKPFMVSFMPIAETPEKRVEETRYFIRAISETNFETEVATQLNISCPNVGHGSSTFHDESSAHLDEFDRSSHKPFTKLNALFPIESAEKLSTHRNCRGIVMGNTIPFGAELPAGFPQIPWEKLFKTRKPEESPLALRFGGNPKCAGGLSGKPLLPVVCHWIKEARKAGIRCHINGGGGIVSPIGVIKVFRAGADSVSLGTITMSRPWMALPCIATAHICGFWYRNRTF